ncbi:MAG: LexA family transcriptional regulator [Bacteroidaceae bacterium]|nr:LexA family transcriptional regulator [Bacteroidaceae bacterium]
MTKKERLEEIIRFYGAGKPSLFAKNLGIAPSTISSWLTRDTFDYDLLFAKCENISAEWLLTGKGQMMANARVSYEPTVGVPYYDVDFIGGFDAIWNDQTIIPAHNIVFKPYAKATLWCNVTGRSMEPKINHGDIIALKECTLNDIQYGEIYAVVMDTIRTVKILRKSKDPNKLLFVPVNTECFDEQEFDKSRIIKVYEVLGGISKFF